MKYAIWQNCILSLIGVITVCITKDVILTRYSTEQSCSYPFQHPAPDRGNISEKKLNLHPSANPDRPIYRKWGNQKKFLFDLIYDSDRLTGFFKLPAEKNGLLIRRLKRIQKQITDHPTPQPALGRWPWRTGWNKPRLCVRAAFEPLRYCRFSQWGADPWHGGRHGACDPRRRPGCRPRWTPYWSPCD